VEKPTWDKIIPCILDLTVADKVAVAVSDAWKEYQETLLLV
jgi:malate dehydrogenase (oxaloacetate-decarboxylating)